MPIAPITVDEAGLRLPPQVTDACDVFFDEAHVWSFAPQEQGRTEGGETVVAWPRAMHRWLDGTAAVSVRSHGTELFAEEVRFGTSDRRIRFVDKDGIPVMVDKWGLLQRPFSGRGEGVVEHMVTTAQQIIEALAEDCGIHAWMAFGTLLGAARSGKVIGYDSDIDLAYLSRRSTPSAMAQEMFAVTRALRARGMRVLNKSGSFVTVLFSAPDGGQGSIDLYTTFYVGDLLHETATVRAPVPVSAIEPLGELEFEGRLLPAPADPDALLTASYGPGWRTPDPSFRHRPGPAVKRRFDPWFGSLMRHRRDWERVLRTAEHTWDGSPFQQWVGARLTKGRSVLDVGAGTGGDTVAFAAAGWPAVGLDYARGSLTAAARQARQTGARARFEPLNLYDFRDVLSCAAQLARSTPAPRVIYARRLLEGLDPDGLSAFWTFTRMLLRAGGDLFVEAAPDLADDAARRAVRDAGGTVVEVEQADSLGTPVWRMAARWTP